MRSAFISLGSIILTLCVITNAHYQKRQFYPSVVYITKSNVSMAVIYLQAFVLVVLMGKLVRKVFFGQLRAAEMEHLIEKSWYAVTETCLAFTVFRDDFSPKFVALFTLLLFLKCFHWLAEDRVDYMERSPIISFVFHMRVITLLAMLGLTDFLLVRYGYNSTLLKGPTVQLVFGFEYAILFTIGMNVFIKYILHTVDLQSENPWENKAVFLLYTELIMGFIKVVLYLTFMTIMIKIHTFPLFAIRPMYLSMRAFKKALHDVIMSRRAIRNMNTLYPNATDEELAAVDNVCIICREEMTGGSGSKKLPCNHIFHAPCLRSWFQRQQTCPTCRMDVLRVPPTNGAAPNAAAAQPAQQQQNQAQPGQQPFQNIFAPGAPGLPPMPFWLPPLLLQQGANNAANGTAPAANASPAGSILNQQQTPQFMIPPFPFLPPLIPPPPPPPSQDFSELTVAELQAMEGNERENIEARIRHLHNIRTLLDAAVLQMQQYMLIVSSLQTTSSEASTSQASQTEINDSTLVDNLAKNQETVPSTIKCDVTTSSTSLDFAEGKEEPGTSSQAAELRRRRLERFESADSSQNTVGEHDDSDN